MTIANLEAGKTVSVSGVEFTDPAPSGFAIGPRVDVRDCVGSGFVTLGARRLSPQRLFFSWRSCLTSAAISY